MNRQSATALPGIVLCLVAAATFSLIGCASSTEVEDTTASDTGSEFTDAGASADTGGEEDTAAAGSAKWMSIKPILFDFDRSDIRQDAVPTLKQAATQLDANALKVIIEGHTDTRGSEEYNLALGERRASATRRYLANLGVAMRQMTIVSYGELRPVAQGNNESAWAMNRRASFEAGD
ncbi:MAG: OmpA family protein [Deltaproteobacteria bacterium]|nr:OmpA family protein [Deltaproteobacteria bacterium]MBW2382833.1 OmpA family protein [Deltaproteobacteria bacterium]